MQFKKDERILGDSDFVESVLAEQNWLNADLDPLVMKRNEKASRR